MTTNESLIEHFYTSFRNKDFKAMQECYADDATFKDPVFNNLDAKQVKAMWEMFCVKSKDLKIEFSNITADKTKGNAQWMATYPFSKTGRTVVNNITANFIFENGKIVKHADSFNFYNWCKQALGTTGLLLGWTPFLKNKVRKTAIKSLNDYMSNKQFIQFSNNDNYRNIRQLALSFPEVTEQPHFEKTSFRIGKKIFATLNIEHNRACIKLSEIDQDVFCTFDRSVIFPVPNKWGKQGWTLINLKKVRKPMLIDALTTAYCEVAPAKLVSLMKEKLQQKSKE